MKVFRSRCLPNYVSGDYYVYNYIDPRNGEVFYIGKGRKNRAWDHLRAAQRNCPYSYKRNRIKHNLIRKILSTGLTPIIHISPSSLSEKEALDIEDWLIKTIGTLLDRTGPLTNIVRNQWCRDYSNTSPFKKISEKQKIAWANPLSGHNTTGKEYRSNKWEGNKNPIFNDHRNWKERYGEERSKQIRNFLSKARTGSGNARAKQWILISPENKIYEINGTLKATCLQYNLCLSVLRKNLNNKIPGSYNIPLKLSKELRERLKNTREWGLYEPNKNPG